MTVPISRKKFTSVQFHRMIGAGILTDMDRVELLNGEIIEWPQVSSRHAAYVDRLNELLVKGLSPNAIVRVQSPIHLTDDSEPQPDLAILRRRDDFYAENYPKVEDIFAVIEVADATVEFDRAVKLPLYTQAGIAEAWIIDLDEQAIEVYREPTVVSYQQLKKYALGNTMRLKAFLEFEFSLNNLFA